MNSTKKVAALALASCMFASGVSVVQGAVELQDIERSYAKDAIRELAEKGILTGSGGGHFSPAGNISRQDFAIVLAKSLALDTSEPPAAPTFSDVPPEHYSYKFIEAAVKAGLLKGVGGGQFGTGLSLSREDMAVLFVRSLGADATGYGDKLSFADSDAIANYARDSVGYAVELGLMNGMPGNGNTFAPAGLAERQQVALVASKFIKTVEEVKPAVVSAEVVDAETLTVTFSKEVKELTAEDLELFTKATGEKLTIHDLVLSPDGKSATLKVDKLSAQTTFSLTYKKGPPSSRGGNEFNTEENVPAPAPIPSKAPVATPAPAPTPAPANNDDSGDNEPANRAPARILSFDALTLAVGQVAELPLTRHFADEDQDRLTYTAISNAESVTAAVYGEASASVLKLLPNLIGRATVTVTANDGRGGTALATVEVDVNQPAPPNATIGWGADADSVQISGVNERMQYKTGTNIDGEWQQIDNSTLTFTNVNPGTVYQLRYKRTDTVLASAVQSLVVTIESIRPAAAPVIEYSDVFNEIQLNEDHEYSVSSDSVDGDGIWLTYNGLGSGPDISGEVTVKVRLKATETRPASEIRTIRFTAAPN
ncbi:S-layer homology domain-containing protein [Paenibacillus sp. TRM 82003]|nr:S-layer homology domain-containing protein [Paenibacillus sp. TRM 82003]